MSKQKDIMDFDKKEELILSYLLGECDENRGAEIAEMIQNDAELETLYQQYKSIILSTDVTYNNKFNATEKEMVSLAENIKNNKRNLDFKRFWQYAAAVILLFAISSIFIYQSAQIEKANNAFITHNVPQGAKSEVTLEDGTKVWLNAGSCLRYKNDYNLDNRNVYLEGEGYFDVVKNKNIPFTVVTNEIEVTALGTIFNVRSYKDEAEVEATLIEGEIKVQKSTTSSISGFNKEVFLTPDQSLLIQKESSLEVDFSNVRIDVLDVPEAVNYCFWKNDIWVIKSQSLEKLVRQLKIKYKVDIVFADDDVKGITFTGKIKDEPLEQVLRAIELTSNISVSKKQNQFEIKRKTR